VPSPLALAAAVLACALALGGPAAAADDKYPDQPLTLIVPFAAGGGTDLVARAFADALKSALGQPVTVANFPGAGSAIGTTRLHAAKADGYTLGMTGGFLVTTSLRGAVKFPATDLSHIARMSLETFVLAVPRESPSSSLAEYLDGARKAPGSVSIGTAGAGALTHLAAEALALRTGTKLNVVHFGGGAKEIAALLGGHVQSGVFSQVEVLPHAGQGGGLRVLATFGDARSEKLPAAPTLKEQGVTGVPAGPWQGVAAPKGLTEPVKALLVGAVTRASQDQQWKAFLQQNGLTSYFLTGPALDAFLSSEIETLGALIKSAGLGQ
jgi:tripartite-type tricarboxylate transporter receptor subunit TctC